MAFSLFPISWLPLASLKAHFIEFYGSGERLVMWFLIDMEMRLDALASFISMISNTCSVWSDTDLTGFWTSSSISCNETASYQFTILRYTGNSNVLECPARSSRLSPRNVMNHSEMIICDTWHSTAPSNLDSSTRLPRTTKLLVDDMVEEGRGDMLK